MRCPILLLALLAVNPAGAHYSDEWKDLTVEQRAWFKGLHAPAGGSPCCDDADGHHVANPDWDGNCYPRNASLSDMVCHYRVRINGDWIEVPDGAVILEPNKYGAPVVWPMLNTASPDGMLHGADGKVLIRCFLPGGGA